MKKRIVVMTGAGISAESGVKTFRDSNGLWEGHDVMSVASPEGFRRDPALVLDFYNQRRRQLDTVQPNAGHLALVALEEFYEVTIVTQNVDDLHERAGSSNIIHLHGELRKSRSIADEQSIFDCPGDIVLGDKAPDGHQLRPHIVWFGEQVPLLEAAAAYTAEAEIVLIVGTSLQVYPAAGLVSYAPPFAPVFYVDPRPQLNYEVGRRRKLEVISEPATTGVPALVQRLLEQA